MILVDLIPLTFQGKGEKPRNETKEFKNQYNRFNRMNPMSLTKNNNDEYTPEIHGTVEMAWIGLY